MTACSHRVQAWVTHPDFLDSEGCYEAPESCRSDGHFYSICNTDFVMEPRSEPVNRPVQVVLEIIDNQVKRGSRIYEREHVRAARHAV